MISRLLRLAWATVPGLTAAIVLLNLLQGLMPVARINLTARLLATLAQAFKVRPLNDHAWLLLVGIALLNGIGTVVRSASQTIGKLQQTRLSAAVHEQVLRKAAGVKYPAFEDPDFHNRLQVAQGEAAVRPGAAVQAVVDAMSTLVTLLSLTAIIAAWHGWMILFLVAPAVATFVINARLAREQLVLRREQSDVVRETAYLSSTVTTVSASKEIRTLQLSEFFIGQFRSLWKMIYEARATHSIRRSWIRAAVGLISLFAQFASAGWAMSELLSGRIDFRLFTLYLQSLFLLQSRIGDLAESFTSIYENALFAAEIFAFIDDDRYTASPAQLGRGREASAAIEFRNVRFAYPGTNLPILHGVTFAINRNARAALVGLNGAGKSTIVKLMLGLYQPDAGEILVDGHNIAATPPEYLAERFSVLFQDYALFHLTIAKNIALKANLSSADMNTIQAIARAVGIDDAISRLPNGYETMLSRSRRQGHELSGGQRQLLALARAFYRRASILVLDEPTSALDTHRQQHIQRLLQAEHRQRQLTSITVSHRWNSISTADVVLVVEQGTVVEQGDPVSLLRQKSRLASLFPAANAGPPLLPII
ncbi:MAG TPA: ABC transporter ATP-binding protein [Opitutaceae bacterium]